MGQVLFYTLDNSRTVQPVHNPSQPTSARARQIQNESNYVMPEINESTPARQLGILRNPRWEAFAHAIARGSTADAAYQEAGYAQSRGNASRLRAVEVVDRRIGELKLLVENLQKLSTHKTVLTQAFVIENLIKIVIDARSQEKPDYAGANKALNLLGLELGMFVEKKEVGKPGEFDGLTIADKRERFMGVAKQLGLVISTDGGRSSLLITEGEPE
jgi:phage terminase small subunit